MINSRISPAKRFISSIERHFKSQGKFTLSNIIKISLSNLITLYKKTSLIQIKEEKLVKETSITLLPILKNKSKNKNECYRKLIKIKVLGWIQILC